MAGDLAQLFGKPLGRRPRCKAARLKHHDLARDEARFEKGERHPRRLACAGGRLQHRKAARSKGGDQRVKSIIDGQGRGHGPLWRERGRCPRGLCPPACGLPPEYFTAKRLSVKNRIFIDQYISLRTVDELGINLLGGGLKLSDFDILVEDGDPLIVIVVAVEG